MLRRHVESWTRGPREGLPTPRLTFFFLKAAPPAVSLPAFLLLESAILISAVVPGEIWRYVEAKRAYVNGKFNTTHLVCSGTSDAGLSPCSVHPQQLDGMGRGLGVGGRGGVALGTYLDILPLDSSCRETLGWTKRLSRKSSLLQYLAPETVSCVCLETLSNLGIRAHQTYW